MLSTLDTLVCDSEIRYIGVPNFSGRQIMKALAIADLHGWPRHVVNQVYYSLVGRDYEWDLMPFGQDHGLGAMVWSPLAWGRLTGRIRRGTPFPEVSRLRETAGFGPPIEEHLLYRVIDALDVIAGETGRSVQQIALNWLLQLPTVSSVIIGARYEKQLLQNLGAVGWSLTPEQVAIVEEAGAFTPPYPHFPYLRQQGFARINPPLVG